MNYSGFNEVQFTAGVITLVSTAAVVTAGLKWAPEIVMKH